MRRLIRAGTDMTPLMRRIAGHLQASTEQSFDKQTSPDGKRWAKLKPSTINRRKKLNQIPIKILAGEGSLLASIASDFDANSAVAGTNRDYATTHQFGAKQGAFGKTKRGAPIPWGDIPARPFLGVSERTRGQISDEVLNFIAERWT